MLWSCGERKPPIVSLKGATMGTTYNIKYINVDSASTTLTSAQMQTQIDNLLVDINLLMSTYIPDSELSRLNASSANVAFPISPETEYVIQEALKLNRLSDGILDITVGPLVNLWGFGPNKRPNKMPSDDRLAEIRSYVGIDKFSLENSTITKTNANVYLDLSTIAKGYAVDEIAKLLSSQGLANYLVEIGGEMRLAGTKINQEKWLVAIEKPKVGARSLQQIISIGDNAIATSGDYRNYFEEEGVRYSHLINPKTGYPIKHNLVAVTVVAPQCIEADGLATALIVMGAERGIKLAEDNNIAALFITKEGEQFVEYQSTEFVSLVEVIEPNKQN
jgi:thiamine biosynthesis lipoprotein